MTKLPQKETFVVISECYDPTKEMQETIEPVDRTRIPLITACNFPDMSNTMNKLNVRWFGAQ